MGNHGMKLSDLVRPLVVYSALVSIFWAALWLTAPIEWPNPPRREAHWIKSSNEGTTTFVGEYSSEPHVTFENNTFVATDSLNWPSGSFTITALIDHVDSPPTPIEPIQWAAPSMTDGDIGVLWLNLSGYLMVSGDTRESMLRFLAENRINFLAHYTNDTGEIVPLTSDDIVAIRHALTEADLRDPSCVCGVGQ